MIKSQLLKGKVGKKPAFTDSEVITLMLTMDLIPFPSEREFLAFIRANYLSLFPKLVDQSQFNRRARGLFLLVEALRNTWINQMGGFDRLDFLLDTKPISVVGFKRYKGRSDFLGYASYGYCTSRGAHYFGYKLVMLSTLGGMPVLYDLVPANTDERLAGLEMLDHLYGCELLAEKGFIGEQWQAELLTEQSTRVFTPKRKNQKIQFSRAFELWMKGKRERIESLFQEVQNTGRNIEHLLAKTRWGLFTRVITRVTSQVFKILLRNRYSIDPLSFTIMYT